MKKDKFHKIAFKAELCFKDYKSDGTLILLDSRYVIGIFTEDCFIGEIKENGILLTLFITLSYNRNYNNIEMRTMCFEIDTGDCIYSPYDYYFEFKEETACLSILGKELNEEKINNVVKLLRAFKIY